MQNEVSEERIEEVLRGLEFPVLKRDAIRYARKNGADEDLIMSMEKHLMDGKYNDMFELVESYLQSQL
ncbi:MAG: DUF2795 domain-containing protein [Desulfovibrionales bacterium]